MPGRLVSQRRRRVHVSAELAAVAVVAPMLWSIAAAPRLTDSHRAFLRVLAVATVLLDGWLLSRWGGPGPPTETPAPPWS